MKRNTHFFWISIEYQLCDFIYLGLQNPDEYVSGKHGFSDESSAGVSKFFVKYQIVSILGFVGHTVTSFFSQPSKTVKKNIVYVPFKRRLQQDLAHRL